MLMGCMWRFIASPLTKNVAKTIGSTTISKKNVAVAAKRCSVALPFSGHSNFFFGKVVEPMVLATF